MKLRSRTVVRYLGTHLKRTAQVSKLVLQSKVLQQRGYNTYVVLSRPPENPDWLAALKDVGARLHYIERPRYLLDISCFLKIFFFLRDIRPEFLHCENIHVLPLLAARLSGTPYRLWQKHAMNVASEGLGPLTLRDRLVPRVRLSATNATRIICVSKKVADELISLKIRPDKVIILNNPIEFPKSTREQRQISESCRLTLALSQQDIVILAVGHAVPVKGWEDLLRAFTIALRQIPDLKLVFVGSYKARHEKHTYQRLLEIIKRERLVDSVVFTGEVDTVKDLLATADIYVLSSRAEGFSNSLVEAFAARVPCISTNVGIAPQLINDGVSGLLVKRGDVLQLASAIIRLAADEELRYSISRNIVRPDWICSLREHAHRLADIYQSVSLIKGQQ